MEIWLRMDSLKQSVEMEGWDINAIKAKRALGQPPSWPESLQGARLRYAKRFLDYMRRARHTKKGCLLVTHGYMLQAWSWMKREHIEAIIPALWMKNHEATLKLGGLMPPWYGWFAPHAACKLSFKCESLCNLEGVCYHPSSEPAFAGGFCRFCCSFCCHLSSCGSDTETTDGLSCQCPSHTRSVTYT